MHQHKVEKVELVLISAIAYVFGSVPFGRVIGLCVARVDVRQRGSGNIGATNVARQVGLKWGILTLFLDGLKGSLPVMAAGAMFEGVFGVQEVAGISAIIGHQFSIFLGFKGGKGVATALGVFCPLEPAACGIAAIIFLLTVSISRYVSLGSIAACCFVPLILAFQGSEAVRIGLGAAAAFFIVIRHKDNIKRLIRGEEARLGKKGGDYPSNSKRRVSSSSE